MSNFRSVMKEGWHPKGKDGGKESWRGDFKGINQVAGWMGKGRDPHKNDTVEHMSRPLSSLKDPASFGPPPKNINYHGGAALPNEVTPHTGGWGAPLTQEQIQNANRAANGPTQEEMEEEKRRAAPPLPYRADRTGLKTDHLPLPPSHRDVNRSPSLVETQSPQPKPGLPPRLPSRQNTGASATPPAVNPPTSQATAPPPYESIASSQPRTQQKTDYGISQGAVNRLSNAGVSVPAFGIGTDTSSKPWQNEQSRSNAAESPSPNPEPAVNQLSELQSRFARMNANGNGSQQSTTPPFVTPVQSPPVAPPSVQPTPTSAPHQPQTQGTTWAEKQAALRTAQDIHRDPSKVSVSDARSAATTANSFRERHQDSINAAGAKANEWNKKYNVTGRLNSFLEKHSSPASENPPPVNTTPAPAPMSVQTTPQSPEIAASISRKPPPPPPKKPANMQGNLSSHTGAVSPPPVPLGTKPSYS
ncbi:uncharacterized protein Z518_02427 [Rhinocladiella mackenziei CBS 650.93]|uniref:Rhinocladiella mackenziei CBS 650.93 unplaced genomic scaffold supercont1.2, whole genome shotgun sequence n=1 Tax=Rhinocladiella mackenziei CBS 650.93 TaxID=1442369 RepID=A0A0D2HBG1_9EURO|nr:uncharacterized protein Z518_02427 [Rhinocladiella mackenziei CBS 650.93]KIX07773.1 hypothetical protein Z518_02427 [Rhinocladiella mackenziei CBS 650.93]